MFGRRIAVAATVAILTTATAHAQNEASPSPTSSAPPHIDSASFAERAVFYDPKLSPVGDRLLIHSEQSGKDLVGVFDLASGALKAIAIPDKRAVAWYRWAGNDRVLISLESTVEWFGEDARMTRLVVYDVPTGKLRFIGDKDEGLEGDDVLYVDPTGDWLLMSLQRTIYEYPSVTRVDIGTNKMKQVVRAQQGIWEWYADDRGVVRQGIGVSGDKWYAVYRKKDGEPFLRAAKGRIGDDESDLDLVRIFYETDDGYVLSRRKTGRYGLYKYNFATRELGDLVYDNPTNDISDWGTKPGSSDPTAVYYTDDRERVAWLDPEMKARQEEIDGALKDRFNWIVSRNRDDSRMLVWTGSATDPGQYYLYVPDAGKMKRMGTVNETLKPKQLAPTAYVKYPARDGLEIPAYLTLPVGRPARALPLIIMPHGGPYDVRDILEFNTEVQFLANRGYAVLQPNYRGSSTYGEEFSKKGDGQWGRKMQDDLDDGMDWLAKAGTIDPKRVCIVGASYGGYAALWGATRNPERYRCGASYAGVTDLRRQLNYQTDFLISRSRKDWRQRVQGQKEFDLDSVSPLRQVARLQVPVLLLHGDADRRVLYKQSSLYADALRKAGKTFEFYTHEDEGHGFSSAKNMKDWLDRLESFLDKYNPAGDAKLAATAE